MTEIKQYLQSGKKAHLIGIGGVSMSPLAQVLHGMGVSISGSDVHEGEAVQKLESMGIAVAIGHAAENIPADADCVIRTAAVHDANPEIVEARRRGIPVFERTQAWGAIMTDYKNAVCISGTHGKTTTTSMCTQILMTAQLDPTVMIGGTLPLLKAGHRVGNGDTIVMESCEYYNSFLAFYPTVAVILNIEADHLDFFKDIDDIKNSFRRFASQTCEGGRIVAGYDDKNAMDAVSGLDREVVTFGLRSGADVTAANLVYGGRHTEFDIVFRGKTVGSVSLKLPGEYNVRNALAAAAAMLCINVPHPAIIEGLSAFAGTERRFQFKGTYNGADIFDDYAHHPSELRSLLDGVKMLDYKRIVAVFQPHTYTRTKALFPDFVRELRRPDITLLAPIFAARESNDVGIYSSDLAAQIPNAESFESFEAIENRLREILREGDILLTIGAGEAYVVGECLAAEAQNAKRG